MGLEGLNSHSRESIEFGVPRPALSLEVATGGAAACHQSSYAPPAEQAQEPEQWQSGQHERQQAECADHPAQHRSGAFADVEQDVHHVEAAPPDCEIQEEVMLQVLSDRVRIARRSRVYAA